MQKVLAIIQYWVYNHTHKPDFSRGIIPPMQKGSVFSWIKSKKSYSLTPAAWILRSSSRGSKNITITARSSAVSGNVGQDAELEGLEEQAKASGASKLYVEDLQQEFVNDFVFPTLKAGRGL